MPASLDIVLPLRVARIEKSATPATTTDDDQSHGAGFKAGYEEGRLRAEWEAARQRTKERDRVRAVVAKMENLHREYEGLLEQHLPDLIQGALARVFRKHPFTPQEIGVEVAALLTEMEQAGKITLECATADADDLRRNLEACDTIPNSAKWTLEGNATLAPGEFLLKSDLGDVDGRLSSRMRQIHLVAEAAA